MFEFASPLGVTRVAEIYALSDRDCQIHFAHQELAFDLVSGKASEGISLGASDSALAGLIEADEFAVDHGSKEHYTAEIRITWKGLGFEEVPSGIKADVGVLMPDSGGTTVDRRVQWSNKKTEHCSDVSIESRLNPRAWEVSVSLK